MNKTLVIIGVTTMIMGIGFGVADLLSFSINETFPVVVLIWTVGAVATVLGLTIFEREGIYI